MEGDRWQEDDDLLFSYGIRLNDILPIIFQIIH